LLIPLTTHVCAWLDKDIGADAAPEGGYMGNPPQKLSAEEEVELPQEFRIWASDEDDDRRTPL
jgi:hypothetical protein